MTLNGPVSGSPRFISGPTMKVGGVSFTKCVKDRSKVSQPIGGESGRRGVGSDDITVRRSHDREGRLEEAVCVRSEPVCE